MSDNTSHEPPVLPVDPSGEDVPEATPDGATAPFAVRTEPPKAPAKWRYIDQKIGEITVKANAVALPTESTIADQPVQYGPFKVSSISLGRNGYSVVNLGDSMTPQELAALLLDIAGELEKP